MEITSYLLGKKAGGTQPTGEISITENGKTNVSGYATADVNVQPTLQNKSVPITTNGSTSVSADENYDGLGTVSITTNVQPNLESKSITITENKTTTITPTTGKDGLSSVEVITEVSGGSSIDWSTIGYSEEPDAIEVIYNRAKDIYDNWDSSVTSMSQMYRNDRNIVIFPLVDTSNVTNMGDAFSYCNMLMQLPALDTSNVTNMGYMCNGSPLISMPPFDFSNVTNMNTAFAGCSFENAGSINAPKATTLQGTFQYSSKLKSISSLNTPLCVNFRDIFTDCENLEDVGIINMSSATGNYAVYQMFNNCLKLTDTSLDNILQSCIGATSYSGTKTIERLGIRDTTVYPASRIQALPHYQDFIDAGWTIS